MLNAKKIGKRIQELRKAKSLTQEEMAEKLDITVSMLSKVEVGARVPSIDMFVILAEFFGETLDYVVLGRKPE